MYSQELKNKWHDDPKNWKLGIFYFNKEDKRWFPPKRIRLMGWTVNFAQPFTYVFLVLIFAVAYIIKTYFKN
jgi:uncharacterized membrane protein